MKKVLVIGAHSFIGQKFKEYITRKNIYDIKVDMVSASDGSWRLVNLENYDTVLHLSGIVHKKEKNNMELLYYEVNHKLAFEIARKSKDNQVKQFIFMSSAAVYGKYYGCITKDTVPNPNTYYGKSKLMAERDILQLQDKDYKIAIVRPPMVYGKDCKGNYSKLEQLARFTLIFPEYHNKRSMLYIDTLLENLIKLIQNENSGYFFPQDEEYINTSAMVVKIRKNLGKETILFHCLNGVIKFFVEKDFIVFRKMFGDFYYDKSL